MALNDRTKQLVNEATAIFSKKEQLNTFWQSVANNFYPQRAFFTVTTPFPYGKDFASNLTTSFPLLVARDLANAISSYLRPRGQQWFKMTIPNKVRAAKLDNEAKKFLEWATEQQFNYLYDRESGFVKATKEGDYDYAVFGQCAISIEVDWKTRNLVHRCWLLKYLAWTENYAGNINKIYHKPVLTIRDAYYMFGDKLHKVMLDKRFKEGDNAANLMRIVMKTSDYYETFSDTKKADQKIKLPYVSVYVDIENEHEIEVEGSPTLIYCIPRWQTISGSQYAYSPAVVAALPDARLIQAITLSLLEAGEKSVNPPILAKQDAVRSDIGLYANSVNWIAESYDGPVDEALQMMQIDRSGLQFGLTMQQDTRMMLKEAFYLNKLNLPVFNEKMTATEVTQRVQEYIRNALPLFEPMETEYNGQLMMMGFETLKHLGGFGPLDIWPDSLKLLNREGVPQEEKIEFSFNNPLIEAEGREKGQKFLEMKAAIAESVALDPSTRFIPDVMKALRDSLNGIGIPPEWINDEDEVTAMIDQEKQQQQAQQLIQQLAAGGQAAESLGKGAQAVQQAGIM